jgi:hypothetical protein
VKTGEGNPSRGSWAHRTWVAGRLLNIPHSIIASSILFDELEVKRAKRVFLDVADRPSRSLGH